jgi:hypothetical protein
MLSVLICRQRGCDSTQGVAILPSFVCLVCLKYCVSVCASVCVLVFLSSGFSSSEYHHRLLHTHRIDHPLPAALPAPHTHCVPWLEHLRAQPPKKDPHAHEPKHKVWKSQFPYAFMSILIIDMESGTLRGS